MYCTVLYCTVGRGEQKTTGPAPAKQPDENLRKTTRDPNLATRSPTSTAPSLLPQKTTKAKAKATKQTQSKELCRSVSVVPSAPGA